MLLVFPEPVAAQPRAGFSGYVVQFPVYQRFDEDLARLFRYRPDQAFDLTRLRIRPWVEFGPETYLQAEYEVSALYVLNDIGFVGPTASTPRQIVDLRWDPATGSRWFVQHFVDRLFFRTLAGPVDLRVGRQRIAWGSGRVWNPTDLFNPLNPTTFSKIEKDGVDAAVAKVGFGEFTDATIVWNPQKDRPSNYGMRVRTNAYGFDGAIVAGYFDERKVLGVDVTGSVLDAGVRFEMSAALGKTSREPNVVRWVFGMDNQFTSALYGMFEVQYNGAGATDPRRYDLLRLLSGEIINVGKQYGTLQASYLISPLLTASASWMQSWTDGSGFYGGTVQYSITDETAASLGVQYFHGAFLTEFRYFPTSVFVRVDTYF